MSLLGVPQIAPGPRVEITTRHLCLIKRSRAFWYLRVSSNRKGFPVSRAGFSGKTRARLGKHSQRVGTGMPIWGGRFDEMTSRLPSSCKIQAFEVSTVRLPPPSPGPLPASSLWGSPCTPRSLLNPAPESCCGNLAILGPHVRSLGMRERDSSLCSGQSVHFVTTPAPFRILSPLGVCASFPTFTFHTHFIW